MTKESLINYIVSASFGVYDKAELSKGYSMATLKEIKQQYNQMFKGDANDTYNKIKGMDATK